MVIYRKQCVGGCNSVADEFKSPEKSDKQIKKGDLSDKVLNPLTTIKGYLDLKSKDLIGEDQFDKQVIKLLLTEIEAIEKHVQEIEQNIDIKIMHDETIDDQEEDGGKERGQSQSNA